MSMLGAFQWQPCIGIRWTVVGMLNMLTFGLPVSWFGIHMLSLVQVMIVVVVNMLAAFECMPSIGDHLCSCGHGHPCCDLGYLCQG